jgi:2-polyprenyl-3-methyl-5-hydroxy-6-metoxy-1,4-benzoquinol methylase
MREADDGVADYRTRIYEGYASRGGGPAARFDAAAADRWGRIYERYLQGWLPADRHARILDVACGGGRLLHFLKARGYARLDGVDVSPEQVALARQVVPEVAQATAQAFLAERRGAYDLVLGLDIVEHLRKDELFDFLDALRGALRPGGRLVLQTPNGQSPWAGAVRYGDLTHETCFTPDALRWVLAQAGFAQVETRAAGPRALSPGSALRTVAWRAIAAGLRLWDVAETGGGAAPIYTRVFLASAIRPADGAR